MLSTITQHHIDTITKYVVKIYFSADSNAPCFSGHGVPYYWPSQHACDFCI